LVAKPETLWGTLYKEMGSRIFKQSVLEGARGWVTSHSYYNTKMYEDILKTFVGDYKMSDLGRSFASSTPKVAIVSTLVSEQRICPYVFRSYELPMRVHSSYR
jgi:hypothetical protein